MTEPVRIVLKILTALLVVAVAGSIVVLIPAYKVWKVREELRGQSMQFLEETSLTGSFRDMDADMKKYEQLANNLDERFPSGDAITFVMQQLGDEAKKRQVEILSIQPVPDELRADQKIEASASGYEKKMITLDMECGYRALGEFLDALGSMPTFFRVMGMRVKAKTADAATLSVMLRLGFYIKKTVSCS